MAINYKAYSYTQELVSGEAFRNADGVLVYRETLDHLISSEDEAILESDLTNQRNAIVSYDSTAALAEIEADITLHDSADRATEASPVTVEESAEAVR